MKTYLTTLGCPKNLVDSEAAVSILHSAGCDSTDDPSEADVLIVSACSFLDVAWRETCEEVHRLAEFKAADDSKKLVLMGCLPKHRQEDLEKELPWVDRFVPTGSHGSLPQVVAELQAEQALPPLTPVERGPFAGFETRSLLTPQHMAYVKLGEGCSRRCTFCAIPKIRGQMVSRPPKSIIREVENLLEQGVREVSLLSQDITSYYADGMRFPDLVDEIARTGVDWIRIFYLHPGSLTLKLARRLFANPAVCRYLEAPIQHASDRVLRRMRRPYTRARLESLFAGLRQEFPDLKVRSEAIVGFPGESDDDFEQLKEFVESVEFGSLGVFVFSPEPNTPAASLDSPVPEAIRHERAEELSQIQEAVAFGLHNRLTGGIHRVLVDKRLEDENGAPAGYSGRYYGQAFEVDGEVLLSGRDLPVGDFVEARIVDADVFDLKGEVV